MPNRPLTPKKIAALVQKQTGHPVREWIKVLARLVAAELEGVEPEFGRVLRRGQRLLGEEKAARGRKRTSARRGKSRTRQRGAAGSVAAQP